MNESTWRDAAYLLDMLIAARRTREFAAGLTLDEFARSKLHQHAITSTPSIVGEAARKVTEQTRRAHPEIDWPQIVGLRNRIVHDYFRLDPNVLWEIVAQDIDRLISLLEPLVPPDEP